MKVWDVRTLIERIVAGTAPPASATSLVVTGA
jgi:hypothetical protein